MELRDDIDDGIEYMFNIYKGEFEEIIYSNSSFNKRFEKDHSTTLVWPVYVIRTSAKCYKIRWSAWTVQEDDPSVLGVYSMYFYECDENSKGAGGGPCLVEISYPEHRSVEIVSDSILFCCFRLIIRNLKMFYLSNYWIRWILNPK